MENLNGMTIGTYVVFNKIPPGKITDIFTVTSDHNGNILTMRFWFQHADQKSRGGYNSVNQNGISDVNSDYDIMEYTQEPPKGYFEPPFLAHREQLSK